MSDDKNVITFPGRQGERLRLALWPKLKSGLRIAFAGIGAGALTYALLSRFATKADWTQSARRENWSLHAGQAGICLLLSAIYFVYRKRATLPDEIRRCLSMEQAKAVEHACARFHIVWLGLWLTWVGMYSWLCAASLLPLREPLVNALKDSLSVVTTFWLWLCFVVLDTAAVERDQHRSTFATYLQVGVLLACACVGAAMAVNLGSSILHGPVQFIIYGVSGVLLGFIAGRLASHWFGLSRLLLIPLFVYPLLQMEYKVSEEHSDLSTLVFMAVLLCKIYLWLILFARGLLDRKLPAHIGETIRFHSRQVDPPPSRLDA